MSVLRRALPSLWSLALAVLLLGPALGTGYVLSYDMVWVPDLVLRPDVLGLGSGLPRAVPSEAVVAVLDQLLGGMILQKIVLLGCLVGGGLGSLRLVPTHSLTAQLVTVTLYQWNPFVAERLLIGHWPVLVGYAVLPWLIDAARRWRASGRLPATLWLLVPLGCLSAGAGLVTAVALVAFAVCPDPRRLVALGGLLLAGNAPWLVAGLLHASDARTDPTGATAFALHGEGSLPAPLAALGFGGIWNADVVPPSRTGALAWVSLIVLLLLVALGTRSWIKRVPRRDAMALLGCWCVGWGLSVLTWLVPDVTAWLYSHLPGAGVIRDGGRALALCVPIAVTLAAEGAARLVDRVASVNRTPIAMALVLVPIALLPDAALGLSGQLSATTYPQDYQRARKAVAGDQARDQHGDLLVLPLTSYRDPGWNGGRKVLDPTGRFLTPDYVASDVLIVAGTSITGEDQRVDQVARALREPGPRARALALGRLGIGYVVIDAATPVSPRVAGRTLLGGRDLRVTRLQVPVADERTGAASVVAISMAWGAFVLTLLLGGLLVGRQARWPWRRRVKSGPEAC